MVRHTAHGDLLAVQRAPGSQSDTKEAGGLLRIIKKHLIEIAHAKKEDRVRVLALHPHVLFEHGREVAHGLSSGLVSSTRALRLEMGLLETPASTAVESMRPMVSHFLHWGHCH